MYNVDGDAIVSAYNISSENLQVACDIDGVVLFSGDLPDYTQYSYEQVWGSKGISSTQGFDIFRDKVFWVSKSGNDTIPSNCYVWNLQDGLRAFENPYITIYGGHSNNLSFDYSKVYVSTAYDVIAYINTISKDLKSFTLDKTLKLNDGSVDLDICPDDVDDTILWSLGHTASSSDTTAPFNISKWDMTNLTDNGDGTYSPSLVKTVTTPQPSCFYFQGFKIHDGLLWYASGSPNKNAYVYAVDPDTGIVDYTINCSTTTEIEGVTFVEDFTKAGGFVMYVGFQGMELRKYTFSAKS